MKFQEIALREKCLHLEFFWPVLHFFPVSFVKFLRTPCFAEHLWATTSKCSVFVPLLRPEQRDDKLQAHYFRSFFGNFSSQSIYMKISYKHHK